VATVGTSSLADVLAPPGNPPIVRQSTTGHLYVAMRTATDTISIIRSTDSGTSWNALWGPGAVAVTFTHTGLQEWSKIVADTNNGLHIAYRVGTGSADTIHYRRLASNTGVWSSALQCSRTDANGGVIGSVWQGVDLAVAKNPDASLMIVVAAAYNLGTTRYGAYAMGLTVGASGGTLTLNNGLISGTRVWYSQDGVPPGRSGISCEIESTGDGYTSSTPHIWITWGRARIDMVKLTYQGSRVGWQGPTSSKTIRSTLPTSQDYVVGRYDGTRYMMAVPSPDDSTMVRIYQRNQANSSTTTIDTPAHTTGTVKNIALSYDSATKNLRVYAIGTSTAVLYYVDYVRATGLWTSWATVVATAVTTSTEWGVKVGGTSGNARHDVLTTAGSVNPFTVTHTAQTTSTAPATAAFITAGQAYTNGGPANVASTLPLTWTFSDADPGQTQGSYALSRQIGSATIAYWNAGTTAWVAGEVQNASVTQGVTLAAAWGLDADLPHTYKVKVWDSAGTVSPGYSAALVLNPSAVVNPVVATPVAASTLTTDTVTVTWTAAQQTGARIVLAQTSPVARTVYDSGAMMGFTDLTYTVPYTLDTATAWTVTLYTYNNEGLASAAQTKAFSVAYAAPPAVVCTPTASTTLGLMSVATSALTPVGTQPAIVSVDVYRRVKTASTLISNGDFNGSTTGFTGSGGTLTYSTTQFHSSPGAARVVPGGSADALVLLATPPDVTAGIAAGKQYTVSGWIRPDTANKPIRAQTSFYNSSGTFLSQQGQTFASVVAGAWHYVEFTGDPSAVSTAAKVGSVLGLASTPAVGDAYYLDDVVLREANTDAGIRIAAGIAAGTTLTDWGASANTDYEYRAVATGANGTSISGPWAG
jgi:hypothetical protein